MEQPAATVLVSSLNGPATTGRGTTARAHPLHLIREERQQIEAPIVLVLAASKRHAHRRVQARHDLTRMDRARVFEQRRADEDGGSVEIAERRLARLRAAWERLAGRERDAEAGRRRRLRWVRWRVGRLRAALGDVPRALLLRRLGEALAALPLATAAAAREEGGSLAAERGLTVAGAVVGGRVVRWRHGGWEGVSVLVGDGRRLLDGPLLELTLVLAFLFFILLIFLV